MRPAAEVLPDGFEERLGRVADLDPTLAKIYAIGITKGIITTHDVSQAIHCPQNTAGRHLGKLVDLGYFVETLSSSSGGGRGSGRRFRVISPRLALAKRLDAFDKFREDIGLVEEHLEIQAEEMGHGSDVWRVSPELLLGHMARTCTGARKTVKIAGNDVSWVEDPEALEALVKAKERGVKVTVFASQAPAGRRLKLRAGGIRIRRTRGKSPVFMLVDDTVLYLPHKEGTFTSRYSALFTHNEYIVKEYQDLFDSLGGG